MGRQELFMGVETENIEEIGLINRNDFGWRFDVRCTQCKIDHSKTIVFSAEDEVEMPHSKKGMCNFLMKCKNCKNSMSATLVERKYGPIKCRFTRP